MVDAVPRGEWLGASAVPLVEAYDVAMFDLDGVVYIGSQAVPGAAQWLARVRESGVRVAFVTNNASRPPEEVAAHLRELGVQAEESDVVTSAQAAARVLVTRFGPSVRIALLGGSGLLQALEEEGLVPVGVAEEAVALVSGYGPDVRWREVMRAAVRVRDGLPWVASNTDLTIPTAYGVAPGHGVLVRTISQFSGVDPIVAGKPARPLLDETVRRVRGRRPLMVGDRVDTDIDGAIAAECDSLLVLTGVTQVAELVAVPSGHRPTYVAPDLGGLLGTPQVPEVAHGTTRLGGWSATVSEGRLQVTGAGADHDWWSVVAAAGWDHLDRTGQVAGTDRLAAPTGRS